MPYINAPSGGSGKIASVSISGTAASGQVPVATSATAGAWGYPPGFQFDYVENTTATTVITATTAATAQTWIDGTATVFDGSTRVKIETYVGLAEYNILGNDLVLELYDGASDIGFLGICQPAASGLGGCSLNVARFLTPSAATHTYHIKAFKTSASGTATLYADVGGAGKYNPAWYRITKA